ncbi:MAG: hypothetical protein E6K81_03020, partial [Candidatus Eisenbacteria bacterium]
MVQDPEARFLHEDGEGEELVALDDHEAGLRPFVEGVRCLRLRHLEGLAGEAPDLLTASDAVAEFVQTPHPGIQQPVSARFGFTLVPQEQTI